MLKNNRNNIGKHSPKQLGPRTNEKIRIPEVLLIDEKGEKVGIIPTSQALDMARDKELDLVEMTPNANPPVCKLMDYGKYKFDMEKKQKENKKNQKIVKVKEIRIKYKTDTGDLEIKKNQAIEFLNDGMKVKISLKFRGREIEYTNLGRVSIDKLINSIDANIYSLESKPALEGRTMFVLLAPKEQKSKTQQPKQLVKPNKETTEENLQKEETTESPNKAIEEQK